MKFATSKTTVIKIGDLFYVVDHNFRMMFRLFCFLILTLKILYQIFALETVLGLKI
jgi:hypothetical protein